MNDLSELKEILEGGQAFSWQREEDCYSAVLNNRVYRISSLAEAEEDPFLAHYFDLDFDYGKARAVLAAKDECLAEAVALFPTLRLLRQDPFTAYISFIISQNNNIKRIKLIYDRISAAYGREVEKGYFTFPAREELSLATEAEFAALGAGFRARYLVEAVKNADVLSEVEGMSYLSAKARLQTITGIGPKVADCILLFGFHRMDAFPIDVWMKKVLSEYYPSKDLSYFEPYPALAQQYLFSWIRHKSN
jgi:3-methyladenine DNA glycosylase/8-oxoguanine DNA glycosylase